MRADRFPDRWKDRLKARIPEGILPAYGHPTFSQSGEDRILWDYFDSRSTGIYVDVGAHHPSRFSNTKLFYDRGWRGVNIDADPRSIDWFERVRPRDKNIVAAVGPSPAEEIFHIFDEPALSTLDSSIAAIREADGWTVRTREQVSVRRLDEILEAASVPFCFELLSIDIEGLDDLVLASLDLDEYKPEIICIEREAGSDPPQVLVDRYHHRAGTFRTQIWTRSV